MAYILKADKIQAEIDRIHRELIQPLEYELAEHQGKCKHPKVVGEYGANTGNFCEEDDSYWIDCFCPTCRKRWTVYSSNDFNDSYREISMRVTKVESLRKYILTVKGE